MSKITQLVTFKLGSEDYAVHIMDVQEIILPQPFKKMPEMPEFVEGVINLRGNVVPIVDLGSRLKLGASLRGESSRIIILVQGEKAIGVVVDQVSEVLRVDESAVEPPSASIQGLSKDYVQGIVKTGDRMIVLLKLGFLFSFETK